MEANRAAQTYWGQAISQLRLRTGIGLGIEAGHPPEPNGSIDTQRTHHPHEDRTPSTRNWHRVPISTEYATSLELWVWIAEGDSPEPFDGSLLPDRLIKRPAQAVQGNRTASTLTSQIIAILVHQLGFEDAAVLVAQPETGHLVPHALAGRSSALFGEPDQKWPEGTAGLRIGVGITGWVVQHGTSARVPDVSADERYVALQTATRSELCVPLKVGERVVGVLNVESTRLDAFSAQDQAILEAIAGHIALALEHGQLLEGLEREILEKRQLEARAAASQHLLQSVTDNSTALIYALDVHGRFILINRRLEALFRVPHGGLLGKTRAEVIPADIAAIHRSNDLQVIAQGEPIVAEEVNDEADGRHTYLTTKFPLRDDRGRVFGVGGVSTDITERRRRERELESVAVVSAALRNVQTRVEMLEIILRELVALFSANGCACALREPVSGVTAITYAIGSFASQIGKVLDPAFVWVAQAMAEGAPVSLERDETGAWHESDDPTNRARFVLCVPLIAREQILGALWVGRSVAFLNDDASILTAVADIAANAIHRITLYSQIERDSVELQEAYDTTIEGWSRAMEMRDHDTEGHTLRVTAQTLALAQAAGVGESELAHIKRGALLHDIGKMAIPDAVLLKPGPLNADERLLMQRHPVLAYEWLRPISFLRPALDIPYCHHERWDGSGYPRGLKGQEIPLAARLFAVVDIWDALRFDRPYRKALSEPEIVDYLRSLSGGHLDPSAVELFLELLADGSIDRSCASLSAEPENPAGVNLRQH